MLSSDFEKEVQQKMEELRFTPPDAVWDNIEASLPEKKRRRLLFLWLLLAALAGSGIWYYLYQPKQQEVAASVAIPPAASDKTPADKPQIVNDNNQQSAEDKSTKSTDNNKIITVKKQNNSFDDQSINEKTIAKARTKNTGTTGATGSKTKTSSASNDILTVYNGKNIYAEKDAKGRIMLSGASLMIEKPDINDNTVLQEKEVAVEASDRFDSALATGKSIHSVKEQPALETKIKEPSGVDTTLNKTSDLLPADASKTHVKKIGNKWEYGVQVAGGVSNVKKGLFEKTLFAADPLNNTGSTAGGGLVFGTASSPTPAFSWSAGVFVHRKIADKWSLYGAVQYNYASNKLQVGKRVDSAISVNFSNNIVASRNYYSVGAKGNYTNQYHLLQLPLLLRFTPGAKKIFYLEAGPSIGYMISANALQYNASRNAYITDKSVFNKWLLALNGGAGVKLAQKTKIPFNLGYRFNYSPASLTKEVFGKQYLTSSVLYLDFRLNK